MPASPETPITHPYLVKTAHGEYVQAPRLRVSWREVYKTKSQRNFKGLGTIREVEHGGWDRSRLSVQAAPLRPEEGNGNGDVSVLRMNGRPGQAMAGTFCPSTAAGVKGAVRRIRPQEAEQIAQVDEAIARAQAQIKVHRQERELLVREAWSRAHVVRLAEVAPGSEGVHYVEGTLPAGVTS